MSDLKRVIKDKLTSGECHALDSRCQTCGNLGTTYAAALELFLANDEPSGPQGTMDEGCAFCREEWTGCGPGHPRHKPGCPWVKLRAALGLPPGLQTSDDRWNAPR